MAEKPPRDDKDKDGDKDPKDDDPARVVSKVKEIERNKARVEFLERPVMRWCDEHQEAHTIGRHP